jgi:hypothetical protein
VRAAVYTRKSSDEGLDQEFNSLDAQHEACSAYIASQHHEGWKLIKRRFDDGGISGGTLERPALQALLSDVDQGLVDMIVVYKIDRLTRSLSDFAKLIDREQFERVQEQLQAKSVIKRGKHPSHGPSAYLVGKVFDETGDRLTPSKSKKSSGSVIRYYYSNRLISGGADPTGWRLRADMLEQLLSEIVGTRLSGALSQFRLAPQIKPHELNDAKDRLAALDTKEILGLIARVNLSETKASIQLDVDKVGELVQIDTNKLDLECLRVEEPVVLRKRTNGSKLTWIGYKGEPNHALIRAIVTAQAWVDEIKAGRSMSDIMQAHQIPEGMIWKRIRLAFLSPKLLQAIVEGTTNTDLSIKMLTKHDLPVEWSEQEALFLG